MLAHGPGKQCHKRGFLGPCTEWVADHAPTMRRPHLAAELPDVLNWFATDDKFNHWVVNMKTAKTFHCSAYTFAQSILLIEQMKLEGQSADRHTESDSAARGPNRTLNQEILGRNDVPATDTNTQPHLTLSRRLPPLPLHRDRLHPRRYEGRLIRIPIWKARRGHRHPQQQLLRLAIPLRRQSHWLRGLRGPQGARLHLSQILRNGAR